LREALREGERLLAAVGAVRVDEELRAAADRVARGLHAREVGRGLAADLHLHARDALLDPAAELLAEEVDRVGREAAAPVDGDARALDAEELHARHAAELR